MFPHLIWSIAYAPPFSSVSVFNFEQVNVSWNSFFTASVTSLIPQLGNLFFLTYFSPISEETFGYLKFKGGMKTEHWAKMV